MDNKDRKNVYRKVIVELFKNKDIPYDIILALLKENNEYNQYLINALEFLNISTVNVEMLIKKFQIDNLINFLNNDIEEKTNEHDNIKEKINECDNNAFIYREEPPKTYTPLTEEEALKIIFLPTETITLPPEGVTAKIRERFIFDEEGIKKECIRTFEIDHDGKVVKYYGEKIRTVIYDNINNYYAGILGENFNPLNEEQL